MTLNGQSWTLSVCKHTISSHSHTVTVTLSRSDWPTAFQLWPTVLAVDLTDMSPCLTPLWSSAQALHVALDFAVSVFAFSQIPVTTTIITITDRYNTNYCKRNKRCFIQASQKCRCSVFFCFTLLEMTFVWTCNMFQEIVMDTLHHFFLFFTFLKPIIWKRLKYESIMRIIFSCSMSTTTRLMKLGGLRSKSWSELYVSAKQYAEQWWHKHA